MSNDFWIILFAALASAWGVRVALKSGHRPAFISASVAFYVLAGMNTVMLAMLYGDGRFVPGYQFSPGMQKAYAESGAIMPVPLICLASMLAHLALLIPRADRAGVLRPLPATVILIACFFVFDRRQSGRTMTHHEEQGPARTAYLSLVPVGDKVASRVVIAEGPRDAAFLRVLIVHDTEITPDRPHLMWTKDGDGLVFSMWPQGGAEPHQLLAIGRDGTVVGELPIAGHDWPQAHPGADSLKGKRRYREAQADVARFVLEHGGIYVR